MHLCKGSVDTASAAIALIAFLHLPLSQLQYGLIATGCSATMVNTQAWRQCMAKRTHQKVIISFVFLFFSNFTRFVSSPIQHTNTNRNTKTPFLGVMQVSHIPEENGEGMQVLHYVNGQKYEAHHDYFHDTVNPQKSNGGQRVATMLMYLTTVEEGGETVFPNSAEKVVGEQWSECARRGLAVKTQKGDALLFFR